MRVAACQAPLDAISSSGIVSLIREQVDRCESAGVDILCCPEGVLGGLADYVERPASMAIDAGSGQLADVLAPLSNETVTTIVGFTEIDGAGALYNSAAVLHRGVVIGVYRKLHPAINRSVYRAGSETPVFSVGGVTFGIIICLDSMFAEPARAMAAKGARVLFVPSNNGLPPHKGGPELVSDARRCDVEHAVEHELYVARADVAGRAGELVSYGSSAIVGPDGTVIASAAQLRADLIVAEIDM
jgi:predicted amidohydrolase